MNNSAKPVRTRFAPSPTGYVHIGNIRTALFAYLAAKHENGVFILRVEDTDRARYVEGALDSLLLVMKQLGMQPDEGYYLDDKNTLQEKGEFGPYLQSQRLNIYQKYAQELLEKNAAYYCYCSTERLEELRKEQVSLKKPPMYDQRCRNLTEENREKLLADCLQEGRKPVVRMMIPLSGETVIHDLIYGDIKYENKILDDQVVLKSDGFPTYHLAVVVDDHLMQITHVIRTDEWLPSTPKHLLLYKAFGWIPPQFAHAPLILNPDRSKLSKRQGDVSAESYLKKGYLPEALINFLAFLGWNPKTEQEIFSMEELIEQFDLSKVNKSGAVFDNNKLDWINSHYIRSTPTHQLVEQLKPYWKNAENNKFSTQIERDEYLKLIVDIEKDRLKKLSEIDERTGFYFRLPELEIGDIAWKKSTNEQTIEVLHSVVEKLESEKPSFTNPQAAEKFLSDYMASKGLDKGTLLWPIRYALTGLKASPSPFELMFVLSTGLGIENVVTRLKKAQEVLEKQS